MQYSALTPFTGSPKGTAEVFQKFGIFQQPPALRDVMESIPAGFGSFFPGTFKIFKYEYLIIYLNEINLNF